MRRTFIKTLWVCLMSLIGIGFLLFFLIWFGVIGYSPDIENLQNPINKTASQIYSADGKIIGTYNADKANRIPVPYSKLSPYLVKALVAVNSKGIPAPLTSGTLVSVFAQPARAMAAAARTPKEKMFFFMVLKQLKIKGNTILHIPIFDAHRLDAGLKDSFLDIDIEDLAQGR